MSAASMALTGCHATNFRIINSDNENVHPGVN
jgi:hypothetical protein